MNKLPVGRTILDAYRFAFSQLGTVIGLIWFPMVLAALLDFLPMLTGGDGATQDSAVAFESLAATLLALLLYAIMYVAVVRQALGIRQGPAVFHFALGPLEFRVYGALLLLYFLLVTGVLVFASAEFAGGAFAPIARAVAFLGILAVIYCGIRLGFLMVPAVVIEGRMDLARIWGLSAGNFWRMVGVLLAIFVPVWLANMAAIFALMGREIAAALPPQGSTDPAVFEKHIGAIERVLVRHNPEIMFVGLILAPFTIGLLISASAFAYRSLAGSRHDIVV